VFPLRCSFITVKLLSWIVCICKISPLTKMHLAICNETFPRMINIWVIRWGGRKERPFLKMGPQNKKVWEVLADRIKTLYFVFRGKRQLQNGKTEINTPCVHWMYCACLVRKICGYYYYKKGVYVQVIRSTTRRYFRGRQHGPSWKCVDLHPKNKPSKNARNHGNLRRELVKYTKEL